MSSFNSPLVNAPVFDRAQPATLSIRHPANLFGASAILPGFYDTMADANFIHSDHIESIFAQQIISAKDIQRFAPVLSFQVANRGLIYLQYLVNLRRSAWRVSFSGLRPYRA